MFTYMCITFYIQELDVLLDGPNAKIDFENVQSVLLVCSYEGLIQYIFLFIGGGNSCT